MPGVLVNREDTITACLPAFTGHYPVCAKVLHQAAHPVVAVLYLTQRVSAAQHRKAGWS
jgi:hypothetical protein